MNSAITFVALLAIVGSAAAKGCPTEPKYTTKLKLSCQGKELQFNWPNYENTSEFWACQGLGRPLLVECSPDTYFSYVLQSCVTCAEYIPSTPCDSLKLASTSSCVPISSTTTTTSTTPTKSTPTTTTKSTATSTTKAPGVTPPSPGGQTAFPPAPSPVTVDPNVPTPPTAPPTPPSIQITPPQIIVPGK